MNFFIFIGILLFLLFMHEMAHCMTAKMLHLPIEEVGFMWKPFPTVFVAVTDVGIPFNKKFWFLACGNLMTFILFFIYLTAFRADRIVYYAFSLQLIIETNPFSSDYVQIIFSYLYKDKFKRYYAATSLPQEAPPAFEREFKNEFMFGKIWYLHFLIWSAFILLLLFSGRQYFA